MEAGAAGTEGETRGRREDRGLTEEMGETV